MTNQGHVQIHNPSGMGSLYALPYPGSQNSDGCVCVFKRGNKQDHKEKEDHLTSLRTNLFTLKYTFFFQSQQKPEASCLWNCICIYSTNKKNEF